MISRYVFCMLLTLIALVAVPFASNRLWAVGLLTVLIGLMLLAMALASAANPTNLHVPWQQYSFLAWSYLALLAWTLIQVTTLTPTFLHHPLWVQTATLLGQPAAGSISLDRGATLAEISKFIIYGGVFWLAMQFAGRDQRARMILWFIIAAAVANALYGLMAHLSGSNSILWYPKWSYGDSVSGTFVNRNHFATYIGLATIISLCFLIEEMRRISAGISLRTVEGFLRLSETVSLKLYLLLGINAVLCIAIVLTGSRGAMAALGAGIAAFLCVITLSSRVSNHRVRHLGLLLGIVGLIGISFSGDLLVSRLSEASDSFNDRLALFGGVMEAIGHKPIMGAGPGTFNEAFQAYRPLAMGAEPLGYDHAHNTYLEIAFEHGLPTLILLLTMTGVVIATFLRGITRRRRNDLLPAIGVGATVLVAVHALFDFSLEIPAVAITYLVIAGVSYAQSFPTRQRVATTQHSASLPDKAND